MILTPALLSSNPSFIQANALVQSGEDGVTILKPALLLVEVMAEYSPGDILTHVQILGNFLSSNLAAADMLVQVACARATSACIVALEDDNTRDLFKPAIQPIIGVVGSALSRGDEEDATSITEYLISIGSSQPIFFKGNMDAVVDAMLMVANSSSLEFRTRSTALELTVTLSETAPALARRCRGLVEGLIPLAFSIMLEVEEDDAEWASGKYTEDAEDENYFVGEEAIERAAAGMGSRVLATPTLTMVTQYSSNTGSSLQRRAAVAGLCRLAEGSPNAFKAYFEQSLSFLTGAVQDTSPRVRYQAIECLGRFACLFPQNTEVLVHSFVPVLTAMLGEGSTCDRVRGHCASALINLINPETCEEEMLQPHLEGLLGALVACLTHASVEVQPFCLDLLGCVAQVSDEAFVPYYASFMPGIKGILKSALGPNLVKLRGKAMECVGLIGDAVGVHAFAPDALEIMQELLNAMEADKEAQDITFEYILPACARMSKALGADFGPYLDLVLTPLLQGANKTIECTIVDAAEDDVEGEVNVDEETGLETAVIAFGAGMKKKVTLNTHAVQTKNQAARMLYEFAIGLKGHLKQYLLPCMEVTVSMITDKHSADVRSSSSLALAKLFEACLHGVSNGMMDPKVLPEVMSMSINKLLENLKGEINSTARACAAECLNDVLLACFNSGQEQPDGTRVNPLVRPAVDDSCSIAEALLGRCAESVKRLNDSESAFKGNEGLEAEDRENFSEAMEEEEELLQQLGSSVGQLLKLHADTGAMMAFFDATIAPMFAPYLQPSTSEHFQIVACCMVDDALEFGGTAAGKYVPTALTVFIHNVNSDNNVLRQCSSYGLAQIVKHHADALTSVPGGLGGFVDALMVMVNREDAQDEDSVGGTENALFALGVLATSPQYRSSGPTPLPLAQVEQATSLWLHSMPLKEDELEAKYCSLRLAEACEQWDMSVVGPAGSNLPHILRVTAELILDSKKKKDDDDFALAHPSVVQRLAVCAKGISGGAHGVPEQTVAAAYAQLGAEHQQALSLAC